MQLSKRYIAKLTSKEIDNAILKIINLYKVFKGKPLFYNFNLTVNKGEVIGIVGPNGSGKTTLIKIIAGLILPDEGQVLVNELDVLCNHTKVMSSLGVLLDNTRCLYWQLSAWQNLVYFCGLKHIFGKKANVAGERLFKAFNLWDFKEKRVEVLSYGQKRRLALVCAIAHNPNLILMDEPTNGLDSESRELLNNWIKDETSIQGKSLLIASHDMVMLDNICTTIINFNIRAKD